MACKFIVTDQQFIMGNVEFHSELISTRTKMEETVLGGGRWELNPEKKIIYVWGASTDYGYAQPEHIRKGVESENSYISCTLEGWEVFHSPIVSFDIPDLDTFTKLAVVPVIPD